MMEVSKAKECFKEEVGSFNICVVGEQTEKKPRRWSELPTGSPKLQCQFLSFGHFLSSLPKFPSFQQTRMWVLSCDFSLGFEDLEIVSLTSTPSQLEKGPNQEEDDNDDGEKEQNVDGQIPSETWPLLKGVERSHSLFLRGKNTLSHSPFECETFRVNNAKSHGPFPENNDLTINSGLMRPYDCIQMAPGRSCLFSNDQEEISETTSRGKSFEVNSSSSCSASSSNCFSTELHIASADFTCFWNTCSHKEKSTDRLFHHILHSHLHRSTDFRSTRCLWRGCSRDGILKVFNSRHKLLVHVGIHCQKLKEPQVVSIYSLFLCC